MQFETLKHRFFETNQVSFWDGQEAENEFKVSCDPLKHRFLDLNQVAFWDGQEAEIELKVQCEPLKHRILAWSRGPK